MTLKPEKGCKMVKKRLKKGRKYAIILGIKVNSTELVEVLNKVGNWITKKRRFFITTPNPEIVMLAQHDRLLSSILNSSDISLPDGIGLVWASKWQVRATVLRFGRSPLIRKRVSGIDVMEGLIKLATREGWRVFLLGGRSNVAAEAAHKLKEKLEIRNPPAGRAGLKLEIQADSGPWLDQNGKPINKEEERKENEVIQKINKFHPYLLFVGFGAPKQEKWVARNYNKLQTYGTMMVGGAFDYLSGRIPRAPNWVRNLGFEWFFRLLVEPWRVRRQLALLRFVWAVLMARIKFAKI